MQFFKRDDIQDYRDYSFSFNYRIKTKNGAYLSMLQRSTFFVDDITASPLAAVGFITDITHFKEGTKIIFTIEITDRNFNTLSKIPLFKQTYFPDKISDTLSKREIQILQFMREGFNSREIAEKLFISVNTIHNHRKNMLAKTSAKNTAELLNYFAQLNM